jgi:hypothetical protein
VALQLPPCWSRRIALSWPPTSSVLIPPLPAVAARIWIYRNDGPNEIQASPYLRLNDRVVGISEPDGSFYRDVMPGRYVVTVDSYLDSYVNQFASVDLGAGQEAYVQVLSMLRDKVGGEAGGTRDIFYTRLIPADIARDTIGGSPFYGGWLFRPRAMNVKERCFRDANQFADVDLAAGQEAYAKILSSAQLACRGLHELGRLRHLLSSPDLGWSRAR